MAPTLFVFLKKRLQAHLPSGSRSKVLAKVDGYFWPPGGKKFTIWEWHHLTGSTLMLAETGESPSWRKRKVAIMAEAEEPPSCEKRKNLHLGSVSMCTLYYSQLINRIKSQSCINRHPNIYWRTPVVSLMISARDIRICFNGFQVNTFFVNRMTAFVDKSIK